MKNLFPYLLTLFVIAALFHAEFLLYTVYALFIAVVAARWWARRALRAVTYRRRCPAHVLLGDAITVEVDLHNGGPLPCTWLVMRETLPVELAGPLRVAHALSLTPGARQTVRYELPGQRRGRYRLGPLRLSGGDLFGQEELRVESGSDDYVTVYPRIVPLDRLGLPSLSPFGHLRSREPLYADPSRVAGVRPYAPGDSARDVHWTASAASGSLHVKTYEPAMSLPTALLLDMSLAAYDRWQGPLATEVGVVVAASLAVALTNARQEVGLFTNGRDQLAADGDLHGSAPGKGQGHLIGLLDLLARVEAVREADATALLSAARLRLPWGCTVVVIGGAGDLAYRAALLALRRAGFSVVQIVVGGRGGGRVPGLPVYEVATVEGIGHWG